MKAAGPLNLPSVRDEGPVSVRRDTNSPEAAGFMRAAQARASGGEAIARGVQAFAAGIDKMAEDRDRAKALAAYNDYVTKSSELLYNADSGFMNAQGAGAEGLAYRVNEAHNTLRGEVADGLSSRQRRLFMESAASYDRDVARSAMRYEGRAMAEYRRTEGARTLENMAAAFAAAPDDISIETQEESIYSVTMALFGDQGEEANAANVRSVRSDFISKAALLIAERDPLRAEAFVRENAGLMDEAAAENVRLKVEASALPVKARSEAEELLSQYGEDGMTEALAAVREAHAGPEAEDYAKYVKSVFGEAKTARAERETEAFDNIVGMIRCGEPLHRINDAIEAVPWARKATVYQLEDMRDRRFGIGAFAPDGSGGGRIKSDPAAVRELTDLKMTGKLTERFPTWESFREAYESRLAPSKYEEYANIWLDVSGKKRSREAAHINASAAYYADHFIEKYHINNEGKQALFRDEMNRSLDAHRAKYGKEPTHSEIYQMAEALGEEIVIGTGRFGGEVKVQRYEIDTSGAENTTVVNGELWVQDMDSPSGWSRYRRSE